MKLVHLSYTAILLASPALALFAQYSQSEYSNLSPTGTSTESTDTNGINWMGEHDISNTTCFNLGNGEKFPRNMKIDSNPGDIAAAKYCMYMSTGENCLCDTQTYEFDLTKSKYEMIL